MDKIQAKHGNLIRRNAQVAGSSTIVKVEKPLIPQSEFELMCEESPLALVVAGIAFIFDEEGLAQKYVTEDDENAVTETINYLGKKVLSKGGLAWKAQGTPDWKTVLPGMSLPVVRWEDKIRTINGVQTREDQLMWDLYCAPGLTFDPNRADGRLVVNGQVTALRVVANSQQADMESIGWISVSKWNKNGSGYNRNAGSNARNTTTGRVLSAISEDMDARDSSAEA